MPAEVRAEVASCVNARGFAEEASILHAQRQGWLQVSGPAPATPALPDLDEGESACIRIALAQAQPTLLLIDKRAGRAVAQAMGIKVAGTASVIGMAKSRGLIPSATEQKTVTVARLVLGRVPGNVVHPGNRHACRKTGIAMQDFLWS